MKRDSMNVGDGIGDGRIRISNTTVRFIGGATNNTISNSNIQGSGTMSVATNGAVIFFSTDANTANGNDNNRISNNNIGPAATVIISGGSLTEPIYLTTGSFGKFRVSDLPVGETYVVSVVSRRFAFSNPSVLVTLDEDVAGLDFVATP